jgi:predicted transglutaminase-like cysteine proteinase
MFARVAACSVAAFLFVSPGPSGDYPGALADADASVMMDSTATVRNEARFPAENLAHDDIPAPTEVAALDTAAPPIKPPAPTEPFRLAAIPWFGGDIFEKWNGVEADIRSDMDILARCRETMTDCPAAAQKFLAIIAAGRAQTGRARIGAINRAINLAVQPMSDLKQWGVAERWSAPLETLTTGRGDCEDYAIAKYVALVAAGVAPDDVKLVVVRDLAVNDGHVVTAVHVDGSWIVLDNRWLTLVEADKLRRMSPQFVIDHTGVRAYVRLPSRDGASAS